MNKLTILGETLDELTEGVEAILEEDPDNRAAFGALVVLSTIQVVLDT